MKSIKYFSALALALTMVACDNYELPNPPGQSNTDPEFVFQDDDINIEKEGTTYNLQQINDEAKQFVVAKVTELKNFPAGYTLGADVIVGNDAAYTKSSTITATVTGNDITVIPTLMNSAIQDVLSKAPGTYNPYIKIVAYAERGTTRIALGGKDKTFVNLPYQITTFDPAKVIEQTYYFYSDADKKCYKMENVLGPGVNAYDSPDFKYMFEVPEDMATGGKTYKWYIIPESAYNGGNPDLSQAIGVTPSAESLLSGKLTTVADRGEMGQIDIFGPVLVTINLETDAYNIGLALDNLYVLSGTSTTKPEQGMTLFTDDYINYAGVATMKGGYYITGQLAPTKNPQPGDIIFFQKNGTEPTDEVTTNPDQLGPDGKPLIISRSGEMTMDKTKGSQLQSLYPPTKDYLYYVQCNTLKWTYNIHIMYDIAVVGSGDTFKGDKSDWDVTKAIKLVPSKNMRTWTSEGKIKLGSQFKFICNGGWELNFGAPEGQFLSDETGTAECVVNINGENVKYVDEKEIGEVNITLDFSSYPYTVTLTK